MQTINVILLLFHVFLAQWLQFESAQISIMKVETGRKMQVLFLATLAENSFLVLRCRVAGRKELNPQKSSLPKREGWVMFPTMCIVLRPQECPFFPDFLSSPFILIPLLPNIAISSQHCSSSPPVLRSRKRNGR
jgi:hypothetical protein